MWKTNRKARYTVDRWLQLLSLWFLLHAAFLFMGNGISFPWFSQHGNDTLPVTIVTVKSYSLWSLLRFTVIEANSGSDGKGEWSEMVRACVEEEWWACVEKSIRVWSEGQEEARMTKEDVEDTSGEGDQECWFGEGRCHESSEMESGSWRDCC